MGYKTKPFRYPNKPKLPDEVVKALLGESDGSTPPSMGVLPQPDILVVSGSDPVIIPNALIDRLKFIVDAPTGGDFVARKGSLTRYDIRQIIIQLEQGKGNRNE